MAFFIVERFPWPQNMPHFPISLPHWTQIYLPRAFFWCLQTASSHWEPDPANRRGSEAIRRAIHVVLSSLRSTGSTVHCLGERVLFSITSVAVFGRFLLSNAPIMQFTIRYWCFFLSKGYWWTKCLAHPKIRRPKPCLLISTSLITLDGFGLLLFTQLTADLTLKWSGGIMFHLLSHIYAKTPFSCVETIANNRRRHVVVFDRLWANAAPALNTIFLSTNVHAKWWIHSLLISSNRLLSLATSIYDQFFGFFSGTTAKFGWPEGSASFVSVRPRLKLAYRLLTAVSDRTESG